ncbi:MAG TPA: hypothetical protein VE954_41435 [Oligoflexus sp.]|uniref:hypothetical protein n=1 Tax=Oligoflexus sp. TaxID=1971216 RepID=UPI002D2C8577|nr:hypothetical protein [Oligoflexus sp.]HYX39605.1 hypothetical protein [Oligoflexus sp.]
MQGNRRQFIQVAATGAAALSCPSLLARSRSPERFAADPGKLLIVFAAAGGASIVDSFLPVVASSDNASIRSYKPEQIESVEGSAFRTVKKVNYALGVPVGNDYEMKDFLKRHGSDMAVLPFTCSSVNHLIAAQRSLNGNGANKGRTLMEAVAAQYGADKLLPNINMSFGGYALDGTDSGLPALAKAEQIADALLFPLALHREQVIADRTNHELLEAARVVRGQLEELQPRAKAMQSLSPVREFLTFRQKVPQIEAAQLLEALSLLDLARFNEMGQLRDERNTLLTKLREVFPKFLTDPLEAQGAMAFLLLRYGVSCSVTIGLDNLVRFENLGSGRIMSNLPLGFDWSHNSHQGAQNTMWRRVLSVMDRLIQLLKTEDHLGIPEHGKMWNRSLMYVATEFGRDRSKVGGSGHDLNNAAVMVSPLLKGNKVYGGVNPNTGYTYGCDLSTGEPQSGRQLSEGDVHHVMLQALGITANGAPNASGIVRKV